MKKLLAVLTVAIALLAWLPGSASADIINYKHSHNGDNHSAFLGTLYTDSYQWMWRRDNGTVDGSDDEITFDQGNHGSTLEIDNVYTGNVYCSGSDDPDGDGLCWIAGHPLSDEDVAWCQAKIQTKDSNGDYVNRWVSTQWVNDGVKNVNADWYLFRNDPRIRVECSYASYLTSWNSVVYIPWT